MVHKQVHRIIERKRGTGMRLTDADDFMKILLSAKRINKGFPLLDDDPEINNYDVGQEETFDLIIRKLSEQPTAYDIEKMVEQLEELQQYYIYSIDDLVRLKEV